MNRFTLAVIATISGSATAMAGGLDRSSQNIDILFEEGTYAELSFGYVAPDVSGVDVLGPTPGRSTGDVADNYFRAGLGYKQDLNDQLSFALIIDQPYGANIDYGVGNSSALSGTAATLDTTALTGLLRYKLTDRFAIHGGLRVQHVNAAVTLPPAQGNPAFGFDGDTSLGYQVGASYEIPEIALRVAATYFSEIDHDLETTVNGAAQPDTPITTPEAINISFQTGIAKDTLIFGSFRYADYQTLQVRPTALGGASITDIDTVRDYTIGVGRRFNEQFSGSVTLLYSDGGDDDVSPLAPTNGSYGITVAGSYQVTEQVRLSGGINYTRVGDASARGAAQFDDNDAIGIGFRIGYRF